MQYRETEGMSTKLHLSCGCVNQGLQSTQTGPELIWKPRQAFTFWESPDSASSWAVVISFLENFDENQT